MAVQLNHTIVPAHDPQASGRGQAAADSAESATPRAGSLTAGPDELASSVIQKLAANETIRCRTR